jgi:DNA invertase Pin-like site-specific DNA recombinase
VNGEHKITRSHRERAALVYLRQSSMAQVREHTESTRSQYALAGKAAQLGWARPDIEVIDADLGISGKWGVAREGFTELVTRACSGEVGAIFGIEITRLARSSADVARLAEFAAITGTLLVDPDGVCDPADVNDRVLLGFKGTMGEMELHVMAQRLQANKRAAAGRGELRTPLPVGYVHDGAGDIVIDPDAGPGRDPGRVRRVCRQRVGLRGRRGVRRPPVPAARLRRRVGRAAALGQAHPRPRAGGAEEPLLRGRLRARPLHLPPHCRPRRHGAHRDHRTAPGRVAGADQRPP